MARRHALLPTALGELTLVADESVLVGCYFPGQRHDGGPQLLAAEDPVLAAAAQQLGEYFAGQRRVFQLPLPPLGERFEERVWALLRDIDYGRTVTYGSIAEQVGGRGYSQRVGQAVGRNPWSIIVPCHRVIGADGSLTGYAGGLHRKRALLELEGVLPSAADRLF